MALKDWMEAIMFRCRLSGSTMHSDTANSRNMRKVLPTCGEPAGGLGHSPGLLTTGLSALTGSGSALSPKADGIQVNDAGGSEAGTLTWKPLSQPLCRVQPRTLGISPPWSPAQPHSETSQSRTAAPLTREATQRL